MSGFRLDRNVSTPDIGVFKPMKGLHEKWKTHELDFTALLHKSESAHFLTRKPAVIHPVRWKLA